MTDLAALERLLAAATRIRTAIDHATENPEPTVWGPGDVTYAPQLIASGPTFDAIVAAVNALPALIEAARREAAMQQKVRDYAVALAIATRGDSSAALREAEEWLRALLHDSDGATGAGV